MDRRDANPEPAVQQWLNRFACGALRARALRRRTLYARCLPQAVYHCGEPARAAVRPLVSTPGYERSRRARYKIEALFAELKQRMVCDGCGYIDCGMSPNSSWCNLNFRQHRVVHKHVTKATNVADS